MNKEYYRSRFLMINVPHIDKKMGDIIALQDFLSLFYGLTNVRSPQVVGSVRVRIGT